MVRRGKHRSSWDGRAAAAAALGVFLEGAYGSGSVRWGEAGPQEGEGREERKIYKPPSVGSCCLRLPYSFTYTFLSLSLSHLQLLSFSLLQSRLTFFQIIYISFLFPSVIILYPFVVHVFPSYSLYTICTCLSVSRILSMVYCIFHPPYPVASIHQSLHNYHCSSFPL